MLVSKPEDRCFRLENMARKRSKRVESDWQPNLPFDGKKQRRPRGKQKRRPDSGVSHLSRAKVPSGCPQHVVCKLLKGLPRLRSKRTHRVLAEAFTQGKDASAFG